MNQRAKTYRKLHDIPEDPLRGLRFFRSPSRGPARLLSGVGHGCERSGPSFSLERASEWLRDILGLFRRWSLATWATTAPRESPSRATPPTVQRSFGSWCSCQASEACEAACLLKLLKHCLGGFLWRVPGECSGRGSGPPRVRVPSHALPLPVPSPVRLGPVRGCRGRHPDAPGADDQSSQVARQRLAIAGGGDAQHIPRVGESSPPAGEPLHGHAGHRASRLLAHMV